MVCYRDRVAVLFGFIHRSNVPDAHGAVAAAGSEARSVGDECQRRNRSEMATKRQNFFSRLQVPHHDSLVATGGGKTPAVRAEFRTRQRIHVPPQRYQFPVGATFKYSRDPDFPSTVKSTDGDPAAVGADGEA